MITAATAQDVAAPEHRLAPIQATQREQTSLIRQLFTQRNTLGIGTSLEEE